jgi:protease II
LLQLLCGEEPWFVSTSLTFVFRSNPFLDVHDSMSNNDEQGSHHSASLLSVHEYDEWGAPCKKDALANGSNSAAYIAQYCPLKNSINRSDSGQRVNVYISAGKLDKIVNPYAAPRFAANVRRRQRATHASPYNDTVVVNVSDSGHEGSSDYEESIELFAQEMAFLERVIK